jgi:hypothetical protein
MSPLDRYQALLQAYYDVIFRPDWHQGRLPLVEEMDRLWPRLSGKERDQALDHATRIYQAIINLLTTTCPTESEKEKS